jgi:hypothetical protein
MQVELGQDVLDVDARGALGDHQRLGDLPRAETLSDEARDLSLALGQQLPPAPSRPGLSSSAQTDAASTRHGLLPTSIGRLVPTAILLPAPRQSSSSTSSSQ